MHYPMHLAVVEAVFVRDLMSRIKPYNIIQQLSVGQT